MVHPCRLPRLSTGSGGRINQISRIAPKLARGLMQDTLSMVSIKTVIVVGYFLGVTGQKLGPGTIVGTSLTNWTKVDMGAGILYKRGRSCQGKPGWMHRVLCTMLLSGASRIEDRGRPLDYWFIVYFFV